MDRHGGLELHHLDRYRTIRRSTEALCEPLAAEDHVVQSMPDASPAKWHLAHTSWFFETFVLKRHTHGYRPFDPHFEVLFNSYYNAVGEQFPRSRRGLLVRPTVGDVYRYRRHVDAHIEAFLDGDSGSRVEGANAVIELGLQHEQQHQELILTDLKHLFSCNPLLPAYRPAVAASAAEPPPLHWLAFGDGLYEVGHDGPGFAFDNEMPRHRVFLEPFSLASRPVTNGEFLSFIEAGGYQRPELWLSDGWEAVRAHDERAPLYWVKQQADWMLFTLGGLRAVDPAEPVCHISYYAADAFARWAGARLPRESEWEVAAAAAPLSGNFVESGRLHPAPSGPAAGVGSAGPLPSFDGAQDRVGSLRGAKSDRLLAIETPPRRAPQQLFGDVWEWTQSAYAPYPGYRAAAGALGEYNAKFMSSQMVLRGGSCVSPQSHLRSTYRNFFPPSARWQFMGLRLARDAT